MNRINKHRLIGGCVLLFAALLFAPTILSPPPSNLTNPQLSVRIDSENESKPTQVAVMDKPIAMVESAENPEVKKEPVTLDDTISLESIESSNTKPSTNALGSQVVGRPSSPMNPIPSPQSILPKNTASIRSIPKPTIATVKLATVSRPKQGIVLESTAPKTRWLRVGSFSSKKNANNLLRRLRKNYPVKVEVSTVDGKTYHRVLVGPYNNENSLQSAKVILAQSGHKPSVQR